MRKNEFDIAKAIAIYMVVWGHIATEMQLEIPGIIRYVHMPIFFFISGYFLQQGIGKSALSVYIKKRIRTLLIPYICWSTIALAANVLLEYIAGELTLDYVKNEFWDIFILARSCWFLIALFCSSIFAGIAIKIGGKYMPIFLVFEWAIMVSIKSNHIFHFYKVQWLFPFMILGILFAKYEHKIRTIAGTLITTPLWAVLYVAWNIFFSDQPDVENYITFSYNSYDEIIRGGLELLYRFNRNLCYIFNFNLDKKQKNRVVII